MQAQPGYQCALHLAGQQEGLGRDNSGEASTDPAPPRPQEQPQTGRQGAHVGPVKVVPEMQLSAWPELQEHAQSMAECLAVLGPGALDSNLQQGISR